MAGPKALGTIQPPPTDIMTFPQPTRTSSGSVLTGDTSPRSGATLSSVQRRAGVRWMLALGAILAATVATAQMNPLDAPTTPYVYGPLSLRPSVLYHFRYDLGLLAERGRHVASEINTFDPSLAMDVGTHWTLVYNPSWTDYTARALHDISEQAFSTVGSLAFEDVAASLSEAYVSSDQILAETGTQTAQKTWATALHVTAKLGNRWELESNDSLNERFTDISSDTRDWLTQDFATLRLSSRTTAALGVGLGYTEILHRPDSYYERYLCRYNWTPSDKVTLALEGGTEVRHSTASSVPVMNNPLLNSTLTLRPFETTSIMFAGSRTTTPSVLQDLLETGWVWSSSIDQRLFGRFDLVVNYTHTDTDYRSLTANAAANRSDQLDNFGARISVMLRKRLQLAAVFNRFMNSSDVTGFSYNRTEYGFDVGFSY